MYVCRSLLLLLIYEAKLLPQQIISYEALVYPLDNYSWYFTLFSSTAVLFTLILIQKCWDNASGQKPPNGWLFQGELSQTIMVLHTA